MRSLAAAAAARCWSTCCSASRDGNQCGALLLCACRLPACFLRAAPRCRSPFPSCLSDSHPQCRATSFGVQATDYQAPPASDPSGSGQSAAQQADGLRRGTERVTLLPKVRTPCLVATEAADIN